MPAATRQRLLLLLTLAARRLLALVLLRPVAAVNVDRRLAARARGEAAEELALAVDELGAARLVVVAAAPRPRHPHFGVARDVLRVARIDAALAADVIPPPLAAAGFSAFSLIRHVMPPC